MYVNFGRGWQPMCNIAWKFFAAQRLSEEITLYVVWPFFCRQKLMQACNASCSYIIVYRPRAIGGFHTWQWLRVCTTNNICMKSTTNVDYIMCRGHDWCIHAMLDGACLWQKTLARCAHAKFMISGHEWCSMLLDDVPYQIRTFHVHVFGPC